MNADQPQVNKAELEAELDQVISDLSAAGENAAPAAPLHLTPWAELILKDYTGAGPLVLAISSASASMSLFAGQGQYSSSNGLNTDTA